MFSDTLHAGADYFLTVQDNQPDGTPTDLTGCTAGAALEMTGGRAHGDGRAVRIEFSIMKTTTLLAVVAAALLTGCAGNETLTDACSKAQDLYTRYQAAEAAGLITDAKTIEDAKKAGAYLALACGWQSLKAGVDHNGVPILRKP